MADETRPEAVPDAEPPDSLFPREEGPGEEGAGAAPHSPTDEAALLARLAEADRAEVQRFLALQLAVRHPPSGGAPAPGKLFAVAVLLGLLLLLALFGSQYYVQRMKDAAGPLPSRRPTGATTLPTGTATSPPLRPTRPTPPLRPTPPGALDGPLPVPEDLAPATGAPPVRP